jgi:hypothetical protein
MLAVKRVPRSAVARWVRALAATACAALSGCSVLSSQTAKDLIEEGSAATGVRYALPRSVVDMALYVDPDKATFHVVLDGPHSIADPQHRYYLQYRPHPSYDDDIAVTVSDKGLLKTVSSTSTDRTKEIILNLVRGGVGLPGLLEAAGAPKGAKLLRQVRIDPTNPTELKTVEDGFNAAVREFAYVEATRCVVKLGKREGADSIGRFLLDPSKEARCNEFLALAGNDKLLALAGEKKGAELKKADRRYIRLEVSPPLTATARSGPRQKPDCKVGICYRPAVPFVIEKRVGKSILKSIVLLPNLSDPVEIDIERAFFVKKYQVVEFDDNGQLKKLTVSKDSELYAISSLPVEVVSAVAESLRLRIKVLDQRINYANSTGELIKARADLEKQRARFESALIAAPPRATVSGVSGVPRLSAPAVTGNQTFLGREVEVPGLERR